ncbi:MAG TPA: penicillin-binding protein 2 [Stellaceae bacterium]|nr:penicillin-binding protein 2 [Stellaceae bacterium]
MAREDNRGPLLTRRAAIFAGGQVALLATLAGRMYYLQVVQADRYAMLADENRINIRLVAPPRGRILDRFGAILADNRPTYRVVLVAEQAGDIESTLKAVGTLIPVSDTDRRRVLRDIRRKHSFVPVMIRENLSWEEMARIEVNTLELPGVSIEQGRIRHYPFGDTASHALGYVAPVSEKELSEMGSDDPLLELPDFRIGKSGIEKAYDLQLRGSAGTSQVEVNAFGRVVRELTREDGIPGQETVLSIDMALQDFAARRCAAEKSAACVLLDAWTGEVLAMVSSPGYDPSAFAAGLSMAQWVELRDDPRNPLSNKAVSGAYAPGSTFKPMVALAALEAQVMTPETTVFCPGHFELGNTTFHCWKKAGHGSMDLHNGIKHSCDVYFFEMAKRLGIDRIAGMAKRFGLGSALGIDIPGEKPGLMPTSDWKLGATGVKWQQGETISAGIGQSYVTATPLQLATMAARLVTGRAVVPKLLREAGLMTAEGRGKPADFPAVKVSQHDLRLVLDGMNAVVNEQGGTAYAARITEPGMQMGGKSGTSQVRHISKYEREHGLRKIKDVPWKERDHALFISFAPVGAPRYVCAVIVEHGGETGGGGSAVAAPICRDVLLETQKRDPARRLPDHPFGVTTAVAQG